MEKLRHSRLLAIFASCIAAIIIVIIERQYLGSYLGSIQDQSSSSLEKDGEIRTKFISFKILRNFPFNFGYGDLVMTSQSKPCTGPERATFQAKTQPGVLDFNTQIRTNLNILFLGSSVGVQFAQGFEEASSMTRQVIRYSFKWIQENTFSSLTPDNGTISGLRVTGLFLKRGKNGRRKFSPKGGGGWLPYDIRELKRLACHWRAIKSINTAFGKPTSPCEVNGNKNVTGPALLNETIDYPCEQKNFDVVVYQPAVEWENAVTGLNFDQSLSLKSLHESVELTFDYLGASTIIIQTIPIQNNANDMNALVNANKRIWRYAKEFRANMTAKAATKEEKSAPTYGRKILVMDLYSLSVATYLQNSMDIGIIASETGKALQSKLLSKPSIDNPFHFLNLTLALKDSLQNFAIPLPRAKSRGVYRKIGLSCGDKNCTILSDISKDGLHWCMDTFAGRLNAGLACLVQCSLVSASEDGDLQKSTLDSKTMIVDCERICNAQYMSLDPVRWENGVETVINGTTFIGLSNYRKEKL